jgi:hypothetical protein
MAKSKHQIWNKAKEEWMSDPSEDSDEDILHEAVKNPRDLDDVDFAPSDGMSLALAYEEVMMSIRRRERRHRDSLRNIYKSKLIKTMFDGVPWSEEQKEAFLKQWQNNFFESHPNKINVKPGRWEQCRVIDRYTAAKFIKHFLELFINNPKSKKAGEVACILWVLIWAAQEEKSDHITIQKVLELSSQDIDPEDPKISVGGVELEISWGLHQLLWCLCGKGEGRRSRRIFANIDTAGKFLERALHNASKELLPEHAISVQPGAFLISPHLYPGVRMTVAQRKAMKKTRPIVKPLYTHRDVKKMLREAQNRN